jgi:hypothetical protein
MLRSNNGGVRGIAPTPSKRAFTSDKPLLAVLQGFLERNWPHLGVRPAKLEKPLSKVHVTVKSVETANRMMQQTRAADRQPGLGQWVVKPITPSPAAIARAGERALQSQKK